MNTERQLSDKQAFKIARMAASRYKPSHSVKGISVETGKIYIDGNNIKIVPFNEE